MQLVPLASVGALASAALVLAANVQDPSADSSTLPPGLAWADVDVDGLPDLLARGPQGGVVLLRNLGDGGFADVTVGYGLERLSGVRRASWNDVDGDGLPDLLLLGQAGQPELLRNFGTFFRDVTLEAGLVGPVAALEEHWLDYDRDGRDDLLLVGSDHQVLFHNLGGLQFHAEALPAALSAPRAPEASRSQPVDSTGEVATARGVGGVTREDGDASARRVAAGARSGGSESSPPPGGGPSGTPGRGTPGGIPGVSCTPSLADLAGGACIEASSVPALAKLYPLSIDFFVETNGDVGMGTTQPFAPLHLIDTALGLDASVVMNEDLIVEDLESGLGLYSGLGPIWGSSVNLGQYGDAGVFLDKWSLIREPTIPGGNSAGGLQLRFGTSPDPKSNQQHVIFEADGDVGIGGNPNSNQLYVAQIDLTGNAARIETADAASSTDTMVVYNNGSGLAINASTNKGDYAIRASGKTGIFTTGSSAGIETECKTGIALLALSKQGNSSPAALLQSTSPVATLWVTNHTSSDPKAASFGGDVDVGYPGFAGLTVTRATVGTDSTNAGFVELLDDTGATRILLDANSNGDGRIITDVLEIKGGADLVESFDTREEDIEPGTVLVIDALHAGELAVSREAYDRKVAGVVSGAGGLKPGLSMGQEGVASGDTPVALTGRVYVKASAENGAIRPGDRLTTAATAGHAMRVSDASRADGAVIGKAMSALDEGTGLVLVLVNLQ